MIKKMLVVDDSETGLIQLYDILSRKGYDVTVAKNGKQALEFVKKDFFPVVLTDIEMPVMDGYALIKNINKMDRKPLIIVLSVHEEIEVIVEIMKKGVFDYIVKPVKSNDLLMKVDRAFKVYETTKKNRIIERERVIGTLFKNLQRSLNQGAGLGTQIILLRMVVDKARQEEGKYVIDEELFKLLAENQKMAEKAMRRFSKVERLMLNKIKTEIITCNKLYSLITKIKEDQKKNASIRNHTLLIKSNDAIPRKVKVQINKRNFQEAIKELLINAMKFSDPDTIIEIIFTVDTDNVDVSIINKPESSANIKGVPEEYRDLVFEPFFRISNYVKEEYKTLDFGLGLTIVEDIIQKHDGVVSVANYKDETGENKGELKVLASIKLPVSE